MLLSNHPKLNEVLKFGKYKGKTLFYVFYNNASYLKWAHAKKLLDLGYDLSIEVSSRAYKQKLERLEEKEMGMYQLEPFGWDGSYEARRI